MKYDHRFTVRAPLEAVAAFHSSADSLTAITPPPIIMRVHAAPPHLGEGDEMDFTMWLGPIPARWVARIEDVSERGFVDRMIRGPFKAWAHTHTFVPVDETTTEVVDHVEAQLSDNWFWKLIGAGMWLGLPILFAYRGWRTRQLLQQ
jgi:ligand-binding SRPBCC domain-containing protein